MIAGISQEDLEKAVLLVEAIHAELKLGTKHYRTSTGQLLTSERSILKALMDNDLTFEPTEDRKAAFDRLAERGLL